MADWVVSKDLDKSFKDPSKHANTDWSEIWYMVVMTKARRGQPIDLRAFFSCFIETNLSDRRYNAQKHRLSLRCCSRNW